MRSIKMLLAMLAVGLLICGSAAVVLAQTGIPGAGYSGPTPFGPGEAWRSMDTRSRGWINVDQPAKPLDTNMGTAGATPFGPGEYWRPNNPAQKGWLHLAD